MTPAAILQAFILSIIQAEAAKYAPEVIAKLPSLEKDLLDELGGLQVVKDTVSKAEGWLATEVVSLLGKAFGALKDLVEAHVSAAVKAKVEAVLTKAESEPLHLTADQVRVLGQLSAAGQLEAVLVQAAKDFLPAP